MSEMVERGAIAIADADADDGTMVDAKIGWDVCDASMREDYRKEARAAIAALREPTEAMISAAMAPYAYGNDETMNRAFRSAITGYWQAMIDEALVHN